MLPFNATRSKLPIALSTRKLSTKTKMGTFLAYLICTEISAGHRTFVYLSQNTTFDYKKLRKLQCDIAYLTSA